MKQEDKQYLLAKIASSLETIFDSAESLGVEEKKIKSPGGVFSHIGKTTALKALKYNEPVIDSEKLNGLIQLVREAENNDEAYAKVAVFLGAIARAAVKAAK